MTRTDDQSQNPDQAVVRSDKKGMARPPNFGAEKRFIFNRTQTVLDFASREGRTKQFAVEVPVEGIDQIPDEPQGRSFAGQKG